ADCWQQVFLDASEKKNLGGAAFYVRQLVFGGAGNFIAFSVFNLTPLAWVAACAYLQRRTTADDAVDAARANDAGWGAGLLAGAILLGQLAGIAFLAWPLVVLQDAWAIGTVDLPRVAIGLLLLGLMFVPLAYRLGPDRPSLALVLATALFAG